MSGGPVSFSTRTLLDEISYLVSANCGTGKWKKREKRILRFDLLMVQNVQVTAVWPDSYSSVGDSQRFERKYRVFHDLWTLLQEVISLVFVIKKVHINMFPIFDGYGVMGSF